MDDGCWAVRANSNCNSWSYLLFLCDTQKQAQSVYDKIFEDGFIQVTHSAPMLGPPFVVRQHVSAYRTITMRAEHSMSEMLEYAKDRYLPTSEYNGCRYICAFGDVPFLLEDYYG